MLLLWAMGCVPALAPPEIVGVSPSWGYQGDRTHIVISGENFLPEITLDAGAHNTGRVDDQVEVWLQGPRSIRLDAVLSSYRSIEAEVPAGLPIGSYDLRVLTPSGQEDTAEAIFVVSDTRADHLHLSTNDAGLFVGEWAELTVSLEDPEGLAVSQILEIDVTAESASGSTINFEADGLDNQEDTAQGIRGWLGPNGNGSFRVSAEQPDDITFTVTPTLDTWIASDSQLLSWSPGGLGGADVTLIPAANAVIAGVPFSVGIQLKDAVGNPLPEETASVILFESSACGGWNTIATIRGYEEVPVTLTTNCNDNKILVYVNETIIESDTFDVLSGPIASFDVTVPGGEITAGLDAMPVFIEALDAYGNRVHDYDEPLRLLDQAGGLDSTAGIGTTVCSIFADGQKFCSVKVLKASDNDVIIVEGPDDIHGTSSSFPVRAADPAEVVVSLLTTIATAGQTFDLSVSLQDNWGNAISFDASHVNLFDDTGTLSCENPRVSPQGGMDYSCTILRAQNNIFIHATVDSITGTARDTLDIQNAELALVQLSLGGPVQAGTPVNLLATGTDIYGNAYTVQSSADIDLSDSTGTLSPNLISLNATGSSNTPITLTRAAEGVSIHAERAGIALGDSIPFTVSAGSVAALQIQSPTWVERGSIAEAEAIAIDAWGNPVSSFTGSGNAFGQSGACSSVSVGPFQSGRAVVRPQCDTAFLGEVLEVSAEGVSGTSAAMDIVDLGCIGGPTTELFLDGQSETVLCLINSSITLHAELNSTGNPVLYHFDDGQNVQERTLDPWYDFNWDSPGPRRIRAVVVDSNGCGSTVEGVAWIGEADGSATGPLQLLSNSSSVSTGSSATISLSATDCTGDPATGSLWAVADLGSPDGILSGSGLEIALDSAGQASFDWDFLTGYATDALLNVGNPTAFGSLSLSVTGDSIRPTVISQSPSGWVDQSTDIQEIVLRFSEPMRLSSISTSSVSLSGSQGIISMNRSLSSDGRTLTLTPDSPLAPTDRYTLSLSNDLRDDAQANRLDGTWSGISSGYTGYFGAVPINVPSLSTCLGDVARFYPDGDPGVGEETDSLQITLQSSGTPAYWWMSITDSNAEEVASTYLSGLQNLLSWDGRGLDGRLVAPGTYTLWIRPVDSDGNIGSGCSLDTDIGWHVLGP